MTKESCNLIGQEAQLATAKQTLWSQIFCSLDDYIHACKKKKNHLIHKLIEQETQLATSNEK